MTGFHLRSQRAHRLSPAVARIWSGGDDRRGAAAQLGRCIADEITRSEVMAVRSVVYLGVHRVVAGVVVVIPLYCVAMVCAFLAARFGTTGFYHQSTGVYDHYFNTFLNSTDLLWSLFTVVLMGIAVMLVHTYYGSRQPVVRRESVRQWAVPVRTSLIVLVLLLLAIALSVYGQSGNFHLSGVASDVGAEGRGCPGLVDPDLRGRHHPAPSS